MAEPKLYQFQRSDMWKPVYAWLETLDTSEIVKKSEIVRWLSENPAAKSALQSRNSRYNFMHYIQKLHKKLLRKHGRFKEVHFIFYFSYGAQWCMSKWIVEFANM